MASTRRWEAWEARPSRRWRTSSTRPPRRSSGRSAWGSHPPRARDARGRLHPDPRALRDLDLQRSPGGHVQPTGSLSGSLTGLSEAKRPSSPRSTDPAHRCSSAAVRRRAEPDATPKLPGRSRAAGSGRTLTRRSRPREARGDHVVALQEDEVVEVVVDEQEREHHAVEGEEVLAGVDLPEEEHPEGAARFEEVQVDRDAEDHEVQGGGEQGEAQAHRVERRSAARDPGHELGPDQPLRGTVAIQVQHDREVLEAVPGVEPLEGHVEVGQHRGQEEENRGDHHQQRLGRVQPPLAPLTRRLPGERQGEADERRPHRPGHPRLLQELGEQQRAAAGLELPPDELLGRDRVHRGREQAVVDDPARPVPAARVLHAVGVGDVGDLVDHVHRGPQEEDRHEQRQVHDRERHDQRRQQQRPERVARPALPEAWLHERHGVGGEQVRAADQQRHGQVDQDVLPHDGVRQVREDHERGRQDDEGQVVAAAHQPRPLPGQILGRHAETAPVEG